MSYRVAEPLEDESDDMRWQPGSPQWQGSASWRYVGKAWKGAHSRTPGISLRTSC
jgi:hypothetical protein